MTTDHAHPSGEIDEGRVAAAHEDLEDDAFRRNSPAAPEDYDRALARYELSDAEASELLRRAVASGAMVAPSVEMSDTFRGVLSVERIEAIASTGLVPEALDLFFDRASKYPLLDASDERRLAQTIESGLAAAGTAATDPEAAALVRRGKQAKDQFICSNIRLVISIAKTYRGRGLDFPDLIQYGILGLNRAVDKFDWRKGYKFSTYATWWIRQSIDRALADYGRLIRLPVHQIEKLKKILGVRSRLTRELGTEPPVVDVAERADLDPAEVAFLLDAAREILSLDAPLAADREGALIGDMVATNDPPLDELAEIADRRDRLRSALEGLSYRERRVIELRYGLGGEEPRTLEEVGRTFNVTRERIRQIENHAKKRLLPLLIEAGLDDASQRTPAGDGGAVTSGEEDDDGTD